MTDKKIYLLREVMKRETTVEQLSERLKLPVQMIVKLQTIAKRFRIRGD